MPEILLHQPPFEIFEADVRREEEERIAEGEAIVTEAYASYTLNLGSKAMRACDVYGYSRPNDESVRCSE